MSMRDSVMYSELLHRDRIGENDTEDYFLESRILGFSTRVIGMLSNIPDSDLHIFMMDTVPLTECEYKCLRAKLHNDSVLSNKVFILIRSSERESGVHSYHIISPHTYLFREIQTMTYIYRDYADMLFFGLGQKRGFWDLRITSKGKGNGDSPTLMEVFYPRRQGSIRRRISMAHWNLMRLYLNDSEKDLIPLPDFMMQYHNEDKMNEILIRYSVSP